MFDPQNMPTLGQRWFIGLIVISIVAGTALTSVSRELLYRHFRRLARKRAWDSAKIESERLVILPLMLGILERTVFTFVVAYGVSGGGALMGSWLLAKMVSGWNRYTSAELQFRTLSFIAMMCSLLSLFFALVGGLVAGGYLWRSTIQPQ